MQLYKIEEILSFIEAFKEKYPQEIEDTFSNGFCYWFAKILELRFGGTIYFNPDIIHFATLIDNHMFDITGLVIVDDNWFEWHTYQLENDTDDIYHSCIIKDV
jgi:hypothetical protein